MTDSYGFAEPIRVIQTRIAKLKLELEASEKELARLEFSQEVVTKLNQDQRVKQLTSELVREVDFSQFPEGIPLHIAWNSEVKRFEVDVDGLTQIKDSETTAHGRDVSNSKATNRQYRRGQQLHAGSRPPQEGDYYAPILKALKHFDWSATPEQLTPLVLEQMRPRLREKDFELIPSGMFIRWDCRMRFARKRMVMNNPPLLNPGAPRGIWEATDEGRRFLEEHDTKSGDDDESKNWDERK